MNGAARDSAGWLMSGRVMHERMRVAHHRFDYPVFYVRCDLARLAQLRRWWFGIDGHRLLSLSTRDYGACDGTDLSAWIRGKLGAAGIDLDGGTIWLQTIPRVCGYAFNPVSFWLCHDRDGKLRALLAEVRNTFGERHSYLLTAQDNRPIVAETELRCRKTLHVSPFCAVEGHYVFRVRDSDRGCSICIDYYDEQGLSIRTAVSLDKRPLTWRTAFHALLRQPFLTFGVIVRIHWQALRLGLKKVPFYGKRPPSSDSPHPSRTTISGESQP